MGESELRVLKMKNKKLALIIIIIALLIKFSLFTFVSMHNPEAKFQADSYGYLNTGMMLASHGVFAQDNNGVLKYELFRTPGYPLFLGLLHGTLKIPLNGIILAQVLLTILAAFVTYKAAFEIDNKIAFLGAAIVLFSLPITVFSLMLLTESLYLFLISLFMLAFIRYLKNRKTKLIVLSGVLLAAATYVRPISYYLGGGLAVFVFYVNIPDKFKKAILHAILFLAVTYGLLGIWQLRNYIHFHQNTFASIIQENYKAFGIFHSYLTNKDPLTRGWPPIPYYVNVTWRCFLSLMTRPGSLKYLHFPVLTVAGKVIGYPWVVFWMTGFLLGLTKIRRNVYYQFILCVILYFVFITIAGQMWCSGERYRVPIMPFIAIISAAGWAKRPVSMQGNMKRSTFLILVILCSYISGCSYARVEKRSQLETFSSSKAGKKRKSLSSKTLKDFRGKIARQEDIENLKAKVEQYICLHKDLNEVTKSHLRELTVTEGATKEEVELLLGKPTKIVVHPSSEMWVYKTEQTDPLPMLEAPVSFHRSYRLYFKENALVSIEMRYLKHTKFDKGEKLR